MTIDEFYAECAALLHTTDECEAFPYYRRNRWNNRKPGRGRFPDHGLIRAFGNHVQIALRNPQANGSFTSFEEALAFLREVTTAPPA